MNIKQAVFGILVLVIIIGGAYQLLSIQKQGSDDVKKTIADSKIWQIALISGGKSFGGENIAGFKSRMLEMGYEDGKNIIYTLKDSGNDNKLLEKNVIEVSKGNYDFVVTSVSSALTTFLKIPEYKTPVFVIESALVDFIKNFQAPESYITGLATTAYSSAPKRLSILKEVVPNIKNVYSIVEKDHPTGKKFMEILLKEAPRLGIVMHFIVIPPEDLDIKKAIASLTKDEVDGYIGCTCMDIISPMVAVQLLKEKIPSINHVSAQGVQKGMLMTYGIDHAKTGAIVADMAIEHMKGKLISQLPVQSERDYQLEINMKTANSIGVTIPDNLKALASKIYSE